ncbi:hypothetical protein BX070DRAFT_228173 [Coemansia spiralis]|nr:hypothetical protein BX070DRAFT_228173 [Coemansia spiralis]
MSVESLVNQNPSGGKKPIEFDIFGYIHAARQTYGLRAQDYLRYRRYCTNHLHNVRKATKLSQGSSTSYRKKDVTAALATEPMHIEILLLQAERTWAFAMNLRELYSRTEEPRQRYHLIRRLRAACKSGRQLADVVQAVCDLRTALAAYAYWLQIRSQLCFELEEWEAALDCAVLSRILSERLALSGSSEQYALAYSMIEALDPILRLSAYQTGMRSAQQTQPPEITVQWYESRIKNESDRVETSVPGYAQIAAMLDKFSSIATDGASSELADRADAHRLEWRGGSISFTNQGLSSLLDSAQDALVASTNSSGAEKGISEAAASPSTLDSVAATFKRIKKAARRCYTEGSSAAAKVSSSASDSLSSSYLAIQLYSTCILHAISVAKHVGRAQAIANNIGMALDASALSFRKDEVVWIPEYCLLPATSSKAAKPSAKRSHEAGRKKGKNIALPELTEIVLQYDMARKSMGHLKSTVSNMLNKIAPGVSRDICAYQLPDEIATVEAYYTCVRGYYAAALHAHPRYKRYTDSLALLDMALTESVPQALSLVESSGKRPAIPVEGSAADLIWSQVISVTMDDLAQVKSQIESAIDIACGLCAKANTEKLAFSHRKSAQKDWCTDPSIRPQMVPNMLAALSNTQNKTFVPARVPSLVDLENAPFAAVPVKPLFYDLAASTIEFNMPVIEEQAEKSVADSGSGGSKLGSIIGSLWGSR